MPQGAAARSRSCSKVSDDNILFYRRKNAVRDHNSRRCSSEHYAARMWRARSVNSPRRAAPWRVEPGDAAAVRRIIQRDYRSLLLLSKHLPVGLAIGIKAIMFTPFPSGLQFGLSDVPVRTPFPQHSTQVLPKLCDGRSAKKPVAVVDLEYYETRFEDDDMRDHRIVLGVRVFGNVEILLNLSSRIR